jgi:DNA-binding CsgD family transcriptional regulator/tetratricopeptide (TPR) repeat protein
VVALVGRRTELATLCAAMEGARPANAQVMLVSGEPGIGKTRLAEELSARATAQGTEVLWATAGGPGAPAFWPWARALRDHVERVDPVLLAAELGTGAVEVAALVPELRARLPALPPAPVPAGAAGGSRFPMFDAITRFLVAAAGHRPLAVVLDDLHEADPGSLLLLEFVSREARGAPLLLVATYRPGPAGADRVLDSTVGELARHPEATLVELSGLTAPEVGTLVAAVGGAEAPPAVGQALHRRTGGNPYLVIELTRLLVARGQLHDPRTSLAGPVEMPAGVRAIVLAWLSALSEPCREVVVAASVVWPAFTPELLAEASGLDRGAVLAALDEARAAGLVRESPEGFTFAHALVPETITASLSQARRRDLHGRFALAYEARLVAGDQGAVRGLAVHASAAGPGDADRIAGFAARAADEAMAARGYEEAAGYCERALAGLDQASAHRGPLLVRLGAARRAGGDGEIAREAFLAAARSARQHGDGVLLGQAALGLGGVWDPPGTVDGDLRTVLDDALKLVPEGEPGLRVRLMARAARAREDVDLAGDAVAAARHLDDPAALLDALVALHSAADGLDAEERAGLTREILALARGVGDQERKLQAEILHARTGLELADRPAAEAAMAAAGRIARGLGHAQYEGFEALFEVAWAHVDGSVASIERVLDTGGFTGPHQDGLTAPIAVLYQLAVHRHQGRLAEVAPLVEAAASYANYPAARHSAPVLLLEAGRPDEARRALATTAADVDGNTPAWALALRAEACVALGALDEAAALHGLLRRHQGHMAVVSNALLCLDPVDRSLGLLARALGRDDEGVRLLTRAVDQCERFGAPALLARSRADLGRALVARGRAGDEARGAELLQLACDEAARLGMAPVADRPGPTTRAPIPGGLTPREVEVLRLVAEGLANKQIARRLRVSEKTAKTHVSNILAKLGVSARTQAATWAVREGLMPPSG